MMVQICTKVFIHSIHLPAPKSYGFGNNSERFLMVARIDWEFYAQKTQKRVKIFTLPLSTPDITTRCRIRESGLIQAVPDVVHPVTVWSFGTPLRVGGVSIKGAAPGGTSGKWTESCAEW